MPDDSTPLLTARQRRLLGFALGLLAIVAIAGLLGLIVVALGRLLGVFSGVLWPLAVAGVVALILGPVVDRLERRLNGRRMLAVILLFTAFTVLVAGSLFLIVPPLAAQFLDFISYLPSFWTNAVEYVKIHYPSWIALSDRVMEYPAVRGMVETAKAEAGKIPAMIVPSIKVLTQGIAGIFGFVTHLAIVPIYLFFFLLAKRDPIEKLPDQLPFLQPSARDDIVFLTREFVAIVVSFFRGQLLIGLMMGGLLAVGFSLVGLKFGLVIGLALGLLNIVPYLGTIIGLVTTLPLAFFQPDGGLKLVALVLLVYIVVQNIEGWILTPKIMGDRTGLHPVAIIVAIFFWGTALDGVFGMILAIPLTAFFVTAWRYVKWRYFNQPQSAPAVHDAPHRS